MGRARTIEVGRAGEEGITLACARLCACGSLCGNAARSLPAAGLVVQGPPQGRQSERKGRRTGHPAGTANTKVGCASAGIHRAGAFGDGKAGQIG